MPTHDDNAEPEYGENIDQATFEQILEMDDDDEPGSREFSMSIVLGFFEQAEETFKRMEKALDEKNMPELTSLGHFLKGSSATLGMTKVQKGCEKIQHYGAHQNDEGIETDESDEKQLDKIRKVLKEVRADYAKAEAPLRKFYERYE